MRVLITGGAGFIGSHLADRFVKEGYLVRILDNLDPKVHPYGRPHYLNPDLEFIEGSVTDPAALSAALRDVDIVSHQAAFQDYMPEFSHFFQVNAVGTALIFETIVRERLPIKKVIVASSQAVYGEGQYECAEHKFFLPMPRSQDQLMRGEWDLSCPQCKRRSSPLLLQEEHINPYNQYAVSKLAQEKLALGLGWLHGIPTVALRYSITQGPRQSLHNQYSGICRIFFTRALNRQPLIIYEDGCQTRDFVHVHDVVDANMTVLQTEDANFQAFNVGSGVRTTVLDYARAVLDLLSIEVELQTAGEYRRGDNRNSVSSVENLKQLGWRPQFRLPQILESFSGWIHSLGSLPREAREAYAEMQSRGVVVRAANHVPLSVAAGN